MPGASRTINKKHLTFNNLKKLVSCQLSVVNCRLWRQGFTLIELLVVMTIIGVVSGLGYVNFDNAQDKARDARRKEDLKAIKTALVSYYQDHDAYPPLCDPLQPPPCAKGAAFISNTTGDWILNLTPYIQKLPKDPRQGGLISALAQLIPKFGGKEPAVSLKPEVAQAASKTLGYNQIGTTPMSIQDNSKVASRFNLSEQGEISEIQWYGKASSTGKAKAVIYDNEIDGGIKKPNSLIATSAEVIINNTLDWKRFTFSPGVSLTPGDYWLGVILSPDSTPYRYRVGLGPFPEESYVFNKDQYSDGPTNLFGSATRNTLSMSIYATYTPVAPVPTVTTNPATPVTTDSATLNGAANPNGSAATGWFRYSSTNPGSCNDSFGTRFPASGGSALDTGNTPVNYQQNITGLSTTTTYYFCAIASNSAGNGFGAVLSFTTGAPPVAGDCSGINDYYCYTVASDRQSFILWAHLDNSQDPDISGKTTALCNLTPPTDSNLNYCLESPKYLPDQPALRSDLKTDYSGRPKRF